MFITQARPHVILLGNQKGGSGKSTLAMHIAIALLKSGQQIVSVDLDYEQRNLTRYIENRRISAKQHPLSIPEHICIDELSHRGVKWNDADRIQALSDLIRSYDGACDFILLDTAGSGSQINLFAHGLADTLITPVNDSFIDLDVIFSMGPTPETTMKPSRYRRLAIWDPRASACAQRGVGDRSLHCADGLERVVRGPQDARDPVPAFERGVVELAERHGDPGGLLQRRPQAGLLGQLVTVAEGLQHRAQTLRGAGAGQRSQQPQRARPATTAPTSGAPAPRSIRRVATRLLGNTAPKA